MSAPTRRTRVSKSSSMFTRSFALEEKGQLEASKRERERERERDRREKREEERRREKEETLFVFSFSVSVLSFVSRLRFRFSVYLVSIKGMSQVHASSMASL
jgi:hypothetical protein